MKPATMRPATMRLATIRPGRHQTGWHQTGHHQTGGGLRSANPAWCQYGYGNVTVLAVSSAAT
jgi:hypothetical protein